MKAQMDLELKTLLFYLHLLVGGKQAYATTPSYINLALLLCANSSAPGNSHREKGSGTLGDQLGSKSLRSYHII